MHQYYTFGNLFFICCCLDGRNFAVKYLGLNNDFDILYPAVIHNDSMKYFMWYPSSCTVSTTWHFPSLEPRCSRQRSQEWPRFSCSAARSPLPASHRLLAITFQGKTLRITAVPSTNDFSWGNTSPLENFPNARSPGNSLVSDRAQKIWDEALVAALFKLLWFLWRSRPFCRPTRLFSLQQLLRCLILSLRWRFKETDQRMGYQKGGPV